MPSTIPSPARRMGTSVSFLPLTRRPTVRSSGVDTAASSSGEVARRLVRHEHRDLVDQLLEDLRGSFAVAQDAQLVLHERVRHDAQRREPGGGVHGAQRY